MHSVESFVNIGQELLRMRNQLRNKSPLGSAQNSVSDPLKPTYDYLDTEKKLEQPERLARKDGNWPDLEAALFHWQLATNRQNNTVTGHLLQEMAKRLWLRMPQYRDLPVPKFSAGWLDAFKTRYRISRRIRHG
jgi:hypothetical protein